MFTPSTDVVARFAHVEIAHANQILLTDVDFSLHKSEFVYLVGRTGAGKSSLLRALYADLSPRAGDLYVGAQHVNALTSRQIPYLRRRLGIVFQDYQLLTDRSVGGNLLFAMKATGWNDRKKMKQQMMEVLMKVGLAGKVNAFPQQLSGGEQQRTAIARALVNDPMLLVADEPTGNLDPEVSEHIMSILHQINRGGAAILMATHDLELIRRHPARVLECRDGRVYDIT